MNEKNVPDIRFKESHGEWVSKLFSEVFDTTIPNNTLSRANLNYENGEVKNIHYGDILIKFGEITNVKKENIPFVTGPGIAKYKGHFLADGDVIFADTAEDDTVGKATEITGIGEEKVVSGLHTIPVRARNLKPVGYLGYYINSNSYHKQLLALMQGIKVLSISKRNLANTCISYPLLDDEQTKIGEFFKNLNNLIAQNQKKYDKLVNMKKACLDKMFPKDGADTPEVRFKGFGGKWEKELLEAISPNTYGGGTPNTSISEFWSGNIPWIQSSDLIEHDVSSIHARKKISNLAVSKSATKIIPKDSIAVVTRVGVGKLAVIPFRYATSQDFLSLSNLTVDKWFIAYSLYRKLQNELHQVQGTSIKGITKDELLKKSLLVSQSTTEQTKIGTFFQNLDTLITAQKTKLEKLKNIKKACLDKMFI